MSIEIKFFGSLADIVGSNEMHLQNVSDTDSLLEKIISDFPKLNGYSFVLAVNRKIITVNQMLKTGDVVAFLPPFAGG